MSVRFEPMLPNFGFDDTVSPEWLMVPVRDEKPIWVVNGGGLAITSRSPAIATASFDKTTANSRPNYQVLRVKGKMTGHTFIELKQGNKVVKRLEVSVKPEITIKLSFHFVSDNAKPR